MTLTTVDFVWSPPDAPAVRVHAPLGAVYNVANLLGAAAATRVLGVEPATAAQALAGYRGVASRFEVTEHDGLSVVVAYAAVPESLDAVVTQLCSSFGEGLLVVFQPNRAWRLAQFLEPYAAALRPVDQVIITDLAQTYTSQTERHKAVEASQGRCWSEVTEEQLVTAISPHARYVSAAALPELLPRIARDCQVVAVIAGSETYLENARDLIVSGEHRHESVVASQRLDSKRSRGATPRDPGGGVHS